MSVSFFSLSPFAVLFPPPFFSPFLPFCFSSLLSPTISPPNAMCIQNDLPAKNSVEFALGIFETQSFSIFLFPYISIPPKTNLNAPAHLPNLLFTRFSLRTTSFSPKFEFIYFSAFKSSLFSHFVWKVLGRNFVSSILSPIWKVVPKMSRISKIASRSSQNFSNFRNRQSSREGQCVPSSILPSPARAPSVSLGLSLSPFFLIRYTSTLEWLMTQSFRISAYFLWKSSTSRHAAGSGVGQCR